MSDQQLVPGGANESNSSLDESVAPKLENMAPGFNVSQAIRGLIDEQEVADAESSDDNKSSKKKKKAARKLSKLKKQLSSAEELPEVSEDDGTLGAELPRPSILDNMNAKPQDVEVDLENQGGHLFKNNNIPDVPRERETQLGSTGEFMSMADAARIIVEGSVPTREQLIMLVDNVYPVEENPDKAKMVADVLKENDNGDSQSFQQGAWVEMLGPDMRWHLATVRRVVRQAPDDWDWDNPTNDGQEPKWEMYYNVADRMLVEEKKLRAPGAALKIVFGMRPWLWQQYALLKMERHLRFQKDNERDFAEVDCQYYASDKFERWLNHPENADFKTHYLNQPEQAQQRLVDHLLKPFELMDEIVEDKEKWDFEDDAFSVYSYMSLMGGGIFIFFVVLTIQLITPFLLLYTSIKETEGRYEVERLSDLWYTDGKFDNVCQSTDKLEGLLLNLAVIGIYAVKIVPETMYSILNTAGNIDTTYSRVNSMRKVVWDQGDDSFLQQLGYKTEMYMNTAYICLIYSFTLFILFNTIETLDIVLNALAIEFIHEIDEQVAAEDWYDPGRRWLTAGTIEMVLRGTVLLTDLGSTNALAKNYDIDPVLLRKTITTKKGLFNPKLAKSDENSPQFKSPEDAAWDMCAKWAEARDNQQALSQFQKPIHHFGGAFKTLYRFGLTNTGVFHRFTGYRTWSYWEKVLYLPAIPNGQGPTDPSAAAPMSTLSKLGGLVTFRGGAPHMGTMYKSYGSLSRSFLGHVFTVLSGSSMVHSVQTMVRRRRYAILPYRVFDGILNWICMICQIVFPFFVVFMIYVNIQCY